MKIKKTPLPDFLAPKGTYEEFQTKMENNGYRVIGSGLFATVWGKKGDNSHVIKVAVDDPGYEEYLQYVLANQENPYFPRVFDVKRFEDVRTSWGKNNLTVVSMELLQAGQRKTKQAFGLQITRALNPYDAKLAERAKAKFKTKHEKQLLAVMNRMRESRSWLDLHDGNIMYRDKQLVIIDPAT